VGDHEFVVRLGCRLDLSGIGHGACIRKIVLVVVLSMYFRIHTSTVHFPRASTAVAVPSSTDTVQVLRWRGTCYIDRIDSSTHSVVLYDNIISCADHLRRENWEGIRNSENSLLAVCNFFVPRHAGSRRVVLVDGYLCECGRGLTMWCRKILLLGTRLA
jgi:hypothetical protein